MTPEQERVAKEIRFGKFKSEHHVLTLLPDPQLGLPGHPFPVIIHVWQGSDLPPFFQSLN